MTDAGPGLRIDKWLWYARLFKSRTLAAKFCETGRLRVNGTHVAKAHALVRPADVLTFPLGPHVRVLRVVALGTRRGPAPEARRLYEDLAPSETRPRPERTDAATPVAMRAPGSGRPTKAQRRALDRWRDGGG